MTGAGARRSNVNPVTAGILGRCPRCGEGALFASYLKLAPACESCELSFDFADAGDGPAVFVMLIVGFLVVVPALVVQVAFDPPMWIGLPIWGALGVALTLALLPPFKGVLVTLQYAHDAHEARLDEGSDPR